MAHPLYGCINSNVQIREYPVAASQYFRHSGHNFVYLDGNGRVTLALTATATLLGMAIVPKGKGAGSSADYWLSGAAGADRMQVIIDPEALFLLLADEAVTEAMKGNACDLISVNDGTQTYVDVSTGTTDVIIIVDQGIKNGGGTNDVLCRINPIKYQAD